MNKSEQLLKLIEQTSDKETSKSKKDKRKEGERQDPNHPQTTFHQYKKEEPDSYGLDGEGEKENDKDSKDSSHHNKKDK